MATKEACTKNENCNREPCMKKIPDKYDFIKRLDWQNYFTEEELAIAELVGLEGLLLLIDHFKGMPVYFTEDRIEKMKKDYIQKNPDGLSKKDLARKMGYSLMTVYRYNNQPDDPGFFDEN